MGVLNYAFHLFSGGIKGIWRARSSGKHNGSCLMRYAGIGKLGDPLPLLRSGPGRGCKRRCPGPFAGLIGSLIGDPRCLALCLAVPAVPILSFLPEKLCLRLFRRPKQ